MIVCFSTSGHGGWNAPKKSTYVTLAVMYIDERPGDTEGHIGWNGIGPYDDEAQLEAFATKYAAALTDDHARKTLLTMRAARHVASKLTRSGLSALALHGEMSQGARTQALEGFKAERVRVLVATDLAARGLDVVGLAAVINYDLPRSPEDYLHRIGRTGRAGERGVALSFISAQSAAHFRVIEKRHQLSLSREQLVGFEPQDRAEPPRDPSGGVKGKRKSKKDKLREAAARLPKVG